MRNLSSRLVLAAVVPTFGCLVPFLGSGGSVKNIGHVFAGVVGFCFYGLRL